MREKILIKEIEYNTQYKVIGEKLLDGNAYMNNIIELSKIVYNADELVTLDDQAKQSVKDVVDNFIQTFSLRGGAIQEQIKFAEETAKIIFGELKENIVVGNPAPCGFGKSSISLEILKKFIELYKNKITSDGLILVTDRLESLRETQRLLEENGYGGFTYILESWNEDICLNKKIKQSDSKICTSNNCSFFKDCKISKQQNEQKKYPILLITNSRLRESGTYIKQYSVYNNEPETKEDKDKKDIPNKKRTILLIDERPDVLDTVKVNKALLNEISTAISQCTYEDTAEKTLFENMFNKIQNKIIDKMQQLRKSYKRFIISNTDNGNICKTDQDFMLLWEKYMGNNFKRELNHIHTVLVRGGFYVYEKNIEFISTIGSKDFKDIYSDTFKTIIFDGTALYDPLYLKMYDNNSIKFLDIDNIRSYKNVIINAYMKNKLSKTEFNNKKYLAFACAKFVNQRLWQGFNNKAYVVTYKTKAVDIAKYLYNKKLISMLDENTTHYFGNTKGKNYMQNSNIMFQFGWDTLPDYEYVIQYLSIKTDWDKVLEYCADKDKAEKLSEKFLIKDRSKTTYGNDVYKSGYKNYEFGLDNLNQFKYFSIVTNFYQEVHRTKLRHYTCTEEKIEVNLFANKSIIFSMIYQLLPGCNLNKIKDELDCFKESKILGRDTKEETISQKIVNWINNSWNGDEIKSSKMLIEIGITRKQFDKAKEKNTHLKELLSKYMVRKGIYQKVS
jgi:hypothetical protein